MTDKIKDQLLFAEVMKRKADNGSLEHHKWDGYCQGLKYCLCVLSESTRHAEHISESEPEAMCIPSEVVIGGKKIPVMLTSEQGECACSPADLQPFGECICK